MIENWKLRSECVRDFVFHVALWFIRWVRDFLIELRVDFPAKFYQKRLKSIKFDEETLNVMMFDRV